MRASQADGGPDLRFPTGSATRHLAENCQCGNYRCGVSLYMYVALSLSLYVPVGPIQAPRNRPNPCPRPCHAGVGNHAGSNSAGVLTATSTPTASRLSRPLRVPHAAMGSTMRVDWLWSLHPVPVNADLQGFLSSQDADVERQVPLVWLWRLH